MTVTSRIRLGPHHSRSRNSVSTEEKRLYSERIVRLLSLSAFARKSELPKLLAANTRLLEGSISGLEITKRSQQVQCSQWLRLALMIPLPSSMTNS
jgi:hypothetical protein